MRLVVGLGNPGARYEGTRHNAGFIVAARFAERRGLPGFRQAHAGRFTRGLVDGVAVGVLLPETMMNRSGDAVADAVRYHRVRLDHLHVVHDELDLPLGTVRRKLGGGLAGHRGLKSIVERCGGPGFHRIRVGIGRPPDGVPVRTWVLSPFHDDEEPTLLEAVTEAERLLGEDVVG